MNKKDISIATKKRLSKIFTFTGEQEQQLEFARQNLCKCSSFEPYASFQRLDRLSKGYLTSRDMLNFMKENGIDEIHEQECKLLIKYFDSTGEDRLMYTDYLQMLLPCDQPYLRAAATQRATYPVGQNEYLPYDVERLLSKLVLKELKLARDSERLKQELASRYDCNYGVLYKEVDDIGLKAIDSTNLKRFLIKTGVFPSDALLIAIIRRFDLDADAKIKHAEFIEGVKPQTEYSRKTVKDKDQTLASSRVLSASKNKSLVRSSSKGRSARKSDYAKSRGVLSSSKKSQKSQRSAQKSFQEEQDERDQMSKTSQSYHQPTKTLEESMKNHQLSSPDQQHQKSRQYAAGAMGSGSIGPGGQQDNSPLRAGGTVTSIHASDSHTSQYGQTISPRQAANTSSYLGKSQLETKSPRDDLRRDSKNMDSSLIYLLREYFKEILAIEGSLDQVKKDLAMKRDFTLAGAFNLFTGYSQARISANEFLYGLERLGVVCDVADARLVVDRYDADQDTKLGFWEFSNSLMPIDPIVRDDLERRKAQWEMSFETKELLRRVFRKIVDAECMVESMRQRISREQSVSLRKAFDSLDWMGRGFLTSSEFRRAFDWQQNVQSSVSSYSTSPYIRFDATEMEAMIRRFNKDKLNGRISLPEFLDELSQKCAEKPY